MPNPVFDAVRTLLAIREYADRPVPDDVIQRIAESAQLTASSRNLQPWHFVVVREKANLEKLGDLVKTGPYIRGADFAVIVACERDSPFGVSDGSRAVQSMMLTAWGDGVGSNWTGFNNLDEVGRDFGLPDRYQVLAVIPFGYPRRQVGRGRKNRRPLGEVVSSERFGKPFG